MKNIDVRTTLLFALIATFAISWLVQAQGVTQTRSTHDDISYDRITADTETKKVELDYLKFEQEKKQFYWDQAYRFLVVIFATLLILWVFPQIQEISIPWAGGTFTAKKKMPVKETMAEEVSRPALMEARETLKKSLPEGAAVNQILQSMERRELIQEAGVAEDAFYLCHQAKKIPRSEFYKILVYVDADEPVILQKMEKVVYHLHETFIQRELVQTDARNRFQTEITAWGEFMLYADVYFRGIPQPVRLKRYLNF